jgi:hypothetical protein
MDCVATRLAHRGNRHYQVSSTTMTWLVNCRKNSAACSAAALVMKRCEEVTAVCDPVGSVKTKTMNRIAFPFHFTQNKSGETEV